MRMMNKTAKPSHRSIAEAISMKAGKQSPKNFQMTLQINKPKHNSMNVTARKSSILSQNKPKFFDETSNKLKEILNFDLPEDTRMN